MFHKEVHVYISYSKEQFFNAKLMAWLLFKSNMVDFFQLLYTIL